MSTRELIRAEIDHIPDDKLGELYRLIRRFQEAHAAPPKPGPGILAKLRTITLEGPSDFAANLDLCWPRPGSTVEVAKEA
jgi:hypothetical protein